MKKKKNSRMSTCFPVTLLPHLCNPHHQLLPPFSRPKPRPQSCTTLIANLQTPYPNSALDSDSHDHNLLSNQWPHLLKVSIGSRDLLLGQAIHAYLLKSPSQNDPFQGNNLINLYAKFGRLLWAQKVFDGMVVRNTITWTSLITGYLESKDFESGFEVFREMHELGEEFNEHTCAVILQACDRIIGEQIHGFVVKCGFEENVVLSTSLITMYLRDGCFGEAERVFNGVANKDLRCLNLMILEYGRARCGAKAIGVFISMLMAGLHPNDYTFTNIISACYGDLGAEEGRQLHGLAVKCGFLNETSVANAAAITMYGRNGMMEEAERVFASMDENNLISWTALISAYTRNGHREKALDVFLGLLEDGVNLDSSLLATVLDSFSESNCLNLGIQMHGFVVKLGFSGDVNIGTALIDFYAKCRSLKSASIVLNCLSARNTASFNAILAGFHEIDGHEEDPMTFLSQMRFAGIEPDSITFSQLLKLSATRASLAVGRSLHAYSIKTGFAADISVANAVITMYAKCGSIEDADQVFHSLNIHDLVSWNSIISACGLHGQGQKAIFLFEEMQKKGCVPDELTILAVLQACTYSGLWEYGICLFHEMEEEYRIQSLLKHYACMVDLLGRAGYLSRAVDFINSSPFPDSTLLWRTLVNMSKLCGDMDLGNFAAKRLLALSPKEAGSYVIVSKLYAEEGLLDEAAEVRRVMSDLKLTKEAGASWIEIDNKVHSFVASSTDHQESREIYARLHLLKDEMLGKCDDSADFSLA